MGEFIHGVYYENEFGPEASAARQVMDLEGSVYPSLGALLFSHGIDNLSAHKPISFYFDETGLKPGPDHSQFVEPQ